MNDRSLTKPALCLIFMALSGVTAPARAADYTLTPSITLSEEYTDNVFETNTSRRSDFITRALPGIAFTYKAPRWDWDVAYSFDYRYYARNSRSDDTTHNLAARGNVRVINEFMFIDLQDTYRRISLDVSRDTSQETLFVNQSDQNTLTLSPYFLWRLGTLAQLKTGYRYVNVWYRDPRGVDKTDHSGYAELSHEFTEKASISAGYTFTHEEAGTNDYDKHDIYAGGRYEYADKSFAFAQVGNSWIRYTTTGSFSNPHWSVGITHDFGTAVATVKTEVTYLEDPLRNTTRQTSYVIDLGKTMERGSLGLNLSYADLDDTMTNRLQTRRYGGTARGSYEFFPKFTGNVAFTAEKYEYPELGTYTRRFLVDSGLSYLLPHGVTVSLYYKYINYYSPGIASDNKEVNRGILEVRKVF